MARQSQSRWRYWPRSAFMMWLSSPRADVGAHPPDSTYGCGFDGDDPCHTPHAPRPATATPRPATATPRPATATPRPATATPTSTECDNPWECDDPPPPPATATKTPKPPPTSTPRPTSTRRPTSTPRPTNTPTPVTGPSIPFVPPGVPCPPGYTRGQCHAAGGTWTPTPTLTPTPCSTGGGGLKAIPQCPTPTPTPTDTPEPDDDTPTPIDTPTPTDTPTHTSTPTPTPLKFDMSIVDTEGRDFISAQETGHSWGVLHAGFITIELTPENSNFSADDFNIQLNLQSDKTGFYYGYDGDCTANLATQSPLLPSTSLFSIVRCAIGKSNNEGFQVLVLPKPGGHAAHLRGVALRTDPIPIAWHRDDRQVTYVANLDTLQGSRPSYIRGVYHYQREAEQAIVDTAGMWNAAAGFRLFDLQSLVPGSVLDVTIVGHWHTRSTQVCVNPNAIACVSRGGSHPNLGHQYLRVKFPPAGEVKIDHEDPNKKAVSVWTNYIHEARNPRLFLTHFYLPQPIAHEWGHTIGLGHARAIAVFDSGDDVPDPCKTQFPNGKPVMALYQKCQPVDKLGSLDRYGLSKIIEPHHANHE